MISPSLITLSKGSRLRKKEKQIKRCPFGVIQQMFTEILSSSINIPLKYLKTSAPQSFFPQRTAYLSIYLPFLVALPLRGHFFCRLIYCFWPSPTILATGTHDFNRLLFAYTSCVNPLMPCFFCPAGCRPWAFSLLTSLV